MDAERARSKTQLDDEDDHGDEEDAEGAAADLAALSTGVVLPQGGQQLEQWCGGPPRPRSPPRREAAAHTDCDSLTRVPVGPGRRCRALERSTLDAFTKLTRAHRNTADLAQHPRYLLLQQVHYATVRRLLTAPPRPREEARLWEARGAVLASTGGVPQLPKDALALLEKHTAPGLRATYQKRLFGPKKENLRKIKKELIKLVPQAEARMPATPPPMPEQLPQELIRLLLQPPGSGAEGESLEAWSMAAEATLALCCITGSLLQLLQLPRAVYCRGVQIPAVPLASRLYELQRRAQGHPSYESWIHDSGSTARARCRLPTPPQRLAAWLPGLGPLLRSQARRFGSSEACGGLRSSPPAAQERGCSSFATTRQHALDGARPLDRGRPCGGGRNLPRSALVPPRSRRDLTAISPRSRLYIDDISLRSRRDLAVISP